MDNKEQAEFSKEQLGASTSILGYFATAFRWVILLAQMQSGKTDAYMFVAFDLLREKKVKKVVLIAGFQDKELIDQLKQYDEPLERYREYMSVNLQISKDDIRSVVRLIKNNISVIYGSQLDKTKYEQASDTLFIWDESHYAQNKINRPFKFIREVDISPDGDVSKLEGERNNYFLSVSATPLSEVSDSIHENQHKKVVKMKPGKDYVSVGKLHRAKKIIGFKNWETTLPVCFKKQKESVIPKISVVRFYGDKHMEKGKKIAEDAGIDWEIYDAEAKKHTKQTQDQTKMQSLNDLENAPKRHKVIFIRGMARMGKRVPKTHISFVMETSKSSNSDVLLQGLLGRMCGYHTNEDILIYVTEGFLNKNKKIGNMSELERYINMMETESEEINTMPLKARNLTSVKSSSAENGWFTTLPIVISPMAGGIQENDRDDPDYEEYEKEKLIATVKAAMIQERGVINNNGEEKTAELFVQVLTSLSDVFTVHKLAKSNGAINETYKDIPQLTQNSVDDTTAKTISSMPGCGFSPIDKQLTLWYYNTNKFAHLGLPKGTIVVHGRTKSASAEEMKKAKMERNIPNTTKLEAFTSIQEDGEVVYGNGSYSIHAPIDTWHSVAKMQLHVENMIRVSLMELEGQVLPRCIVSNQITGSKWQGILVNDAVLKALEKKGSIYNYLYSTYDVKLRIARKSGTVPADLKEMGQVRLAKIEW
jgi:hypothetical protein